MAGKYGEIPNVKKFAPWRDRFGGGGVRLTPFDKLRVSAVVGERG